MALIVEDGTGLETAEAYVSVADFKTYCDNHGLSYSAYSDGQIEQGLRRGTTWLDATYLTRFMGVKVNAYDQALEWPREAIIPGCDLKDASGYVIPALTVPPQIIKACNEASFRELVTPGILTPDIALTERRKSVRVEGAVSVEYADVKDPEAAIPVITLIDGILAGLLGRRTKTTSGSFSRS